MQPKGETAMREIKVFDPFNVGFSNFFRNFFDDEGLRPLMEEGSLAVDVSQGKEGETIVRANLPGFKKEDVQLSVHNGVLDIRAESKQEDEVKHEKFYRRERRVSSVTRRVALPGNPSGDDVQAELKDGVLTVKVPGSTKNGPKQIAVN
jgi:HSP20 family protein